MANTRLLPWFKSTTTRTPYVAFERCRRPVRFGFYAVISVQFGAIVWFGIFNTQALADWTLTTTRGLCAALGIVWFGGPIVLAGFLIHTLWSPTRRLRRFVGRCLNCGSRIHSEFLDDCSECESSLAEQRCYRRLILAPMASCFDSHVPPFRGLRRRVSYLERSRNRLAFGWGAWVLMVFGWVFWLFETTSYGEGPRTLNAGQIACLILILAHVVLLCVTTMKYHLEFVWKNVCRLRGCCYHCESTVRRDEDLCGRCGTSLILQRMCVASWLRHVRGQIKRTPRIHSALEAATERSSV